MIFTRKHYLVLVLTVMVLTVAAAAYWFKNAGPFYMPDVQLKTIDGEVLDLRALEGKPVFVTFWASTCGKCRREMPSWVKLYNEYGPKGLQMVSIVVHWNKPEDLNKYLQNNQLPFPVALDYNKKANNAFGRVYFTPTSFLVSSSGRIVFRKHGEWNFEELKQRIKRLLED